MPRIEKQDLIQGFGQATPEQITLINWFYSQFDYSVAGSGLNRHIANVEPVFFTGAIAGAEFATYAATKLYICFTMVAAATGAAAQATVQMVTIYDPANAAMMYLHKNYPMYEPVAAASWYTRPTTILNNFYFSRVGFTGYANLIFNGYRITLN